MVVAYGATLGVLVPQCMTLHSHSTKSGAVQVARPRASWSPHALRSLVDGAVRQIDLQPWCSGPLVSGASHGPLLAIGRRPPCVAGGRGRSLGPTVAGGSRR